MKIQSGKHYMSSTTLLQGSWNATYKVNNIVRSGHPVPLNHDHTHFMLVDDGFRGRYGGVAEFRASLERKLSLPQGNGTESIEGTKSNLFSCQT